MNTTARTLIAAAAVLLAAAGSSRASSPSAVAVTKNAPAEAEHMTIVVGQESYQVNGTYKTTKSLIEYFNTAQLNTDQEVRIKVDKKVRQVRVVRILDLLKEKGFQNVALQTQ